MSKWHMRGHFGHLNFKTFSLIERTPQCEVFWPLNSSSEFLGIPEDSNFPLLGVWVSSSHLSQSGVATLPLLIWLFKARKRWFDQWTLDLNSFSSALAIHYDTYSMLVHGIKTYWNSSQFFKVAYVINDQMPTFVFDSFMCHKSATSLWHERLWIEFAKQWKWKISMLIPCT